MKNSLSFTILELLIALSLSSFVILGMLQGYRNISNYIDRTRRLMVVNRQVCLFFNQIERDLNASFIPFLHEEIKSTQEKADVGAQALKEKAAEKEKEEKKNYFVGQIKEGEEVKVGGRRREFFKSVNFITTNALRIYGQKRVRLVRVMYELVKDKQRSKGEKVCYNLFRRETTNLKNFQFKEEESVLEKNKKTSIKTHLIAENVKELFFEYITPQTEKEKEKEVIAKEEKKRVRRFVWGDKDETRDVVPEQTEIFVTFWDDELERAYSFECLIPVFSYPTEKKEKKEEKKETEKTPEASSENTPTTPGPEASNVAVSVPSVVSGRARA